MKPGRELDALVAEKVMGWVKRPSEVDYFGPVWSPPGSRDTYDGPPEFSTDIAAAWEVLNHFVSQDEMTTWELGKCEPKGKLFYCKFEMWDREGKQWIYPIEKATTAPLAICLAALKAVEGK